LTDDFAKGIKLHVSDPIITFKETIVDRRLADKKKRIVKGGAGAVGTGQWEEVETSSEEEQE
jgi:hypothetical protein